MTALKALTMRTKRRVLRTIRRIRRRPSVTDKAELSLIADGYGGGRVWRDESGHKHHAVLENNDDVE